MFEALALCATLAVQGAPPEGGQHPAPHGGLLAAEGQGHLELVVGPNRLAIYPLDAALGPVPLSGADARLLTASGPEPLPLTAARDHWEAANPFGTDEPMTLVAVVARRAGATATRFAFSPGQGSTYHDHRPLHGGLVGMAGERHLELALSQGASGAELQLYLSNAYRQPSSLAGITGQVTVTHRDRTATYPLADGGDCLVAKLAAAHGPLDVHAHLIYPGDPLPVDMDFYLDQSQATSKPGAPITIRVGGGGFSPSQIEGRPGEPVTLRFFRTTDQTCATRVVFPALGLSRDLPLRRAVEVSIMPHAGILQFTCGMGMFHGEVQAR